jgi:hypothetical protein
MNSLNYEYIYIYSIIGEYINMQSILEYSKNKGLRGDYIEQSKKYKDFLYVDGDIISLIKQPNQVFTPEDMYNIFNNWLAINYENILKSYKKIYKTKFNEDLLQDAILYVIDCIKKSKYVKKFDVYIGLKYKSNCADDIKIQKQRKINGFTNDFDIYTDDDGDGESYIQNYAEISYFDTNTEYDCINDYNSIKRLDVIGYILKEHMSFDRANLYINILQTDVARSETNLLDIPKIKYYNIIKKYKQDIDYIKLVDKIKTSDTQFLNDLNKICWDIIINNIDRIKQECDVYTFKNLDDYTLKDF